MLSNGNTCRRGTQKGEEGAVSAWQGERHSKWGGQKRRAETSEPCPGEGEEPSYEESGE